MPKRRSSRHRGKRRHEFHSNNCSYCNGPISGFPHICKFCGRRHCDDHIVPEDHKCYGLNRNSSWKQPRKAYHEEVGNNFLSTDNNYHKSRGYSHQSRRKHFSIPRIRFPRTNTFVKALIFAIVTFVLAYNYRQNTIILWIEAIAWIYLSWILLRKALRWANRISMGDDLAFFGLRILGAIVTIIGAYLLIAALIASAFVRGSAYEAIPIYSLIVGLIILGAFIAFRTNRRHHVVGIWGA